ncbi:hypothetical protein C8J56DRAFT_1060721 [Mycena floridula]|nr:hypothetical protein C8J56DRAFT_1060721 [Mycena floridula]
MNLALSYLQEYWGSFQRKTEPSDSGSLARISPSTSTTSSSSSEPTQTPQSSYSGSPATISPSTSTTSSSSSEPTQTPQSSDSGSPATISPSTSAISSSSSEPTRPIFPENTDEDPKLIAPYSNEWKIFLEITDRAIKPDSMSLPANWDNDWRDWQFCSHLVGPFEKSTFEINLIEKFGLVFEHVQILMYELETEMLVFQYHNSYYKYAMHDAILLLYPGSYDSVDTFLEKWPVIDRAEKQNVDPTGTDENCLRIIHAQFRKVVEIERKMFGPLRIPHFIDVEDIYEDYRIPAKTTVLVDMWATLLDEVNTTGYLRCESNLRETVFPDPSLDPDVLNPESMVFGYGRRKTYSSRSGLATMLTMFKIEEDESVGGSPYEYSDHLILLESI